VASGMELSLSLYVVANIGKERTLRFAALQRMSEPPSLTNTASHTNTPSALGVFIPDDGVFEVRVEKKSHHLVTITLNPCAKSPGPGEPDSWGHCRHMDKMVAVLRIHAAKVRR